MPEVTPNHAPSPRAALGTDTANYFVLRTDATGHLQIHVLTSGLPLGAATAAAQALALAQLQLIEDLRNALQSVASDRLIVRGEDQLFSIGKVVANVRSAVVSGAGGYVDSQPCPANRFWVITTVAGRDVTTATTWHIHYNRHDATNVQFYLEERAFGISSPSIWGGQTFLDADDVIRVTFGGSLAADTCEVSLTGYEITWEG